MQTTVDTFLSILTELVFGFLLYLDNIKVKNMPDMQIKIKNSKKLRVESTVLYKKIFLKIKKKNLDKNNVFHHEPLSMMIFHNHMKEVRFLEKSGSLLLLMLKIVLSKKKSLFLEYLDIFIYSVKNVKK
jgi:hypothetical protein